MIRKLLAVVLTSVPLAAFAADPLVPLEPANVDVSNQRSLQRGARLFVENCMGCHSVQYMRWERVANDIGIPVEHMQQFLQVTGERPGDQMRIAMPPTDGASWFGISPPDLTLVARSRGTDWVYNFLLNFYVDESQPLGADNLIFPQVGMPHVLWEKQGMQRAVFREETDGAGNTRQVFDRFEQLTEGTSTPEEFRREMRDLTAFLVYLGEPMQVQRQTLGMLVIFFLLIFLGFAYMLKREYWKDVH